MSRLGAKILVTATLLVIGLSSITSAEAYFWDRRSVDEISITTGTLDFLLAPEVESENESLRLVEITNTGTLPFIYEVEGVFVESEDVSCESVRIRLGGEEFSARADLGRLEVGESRELRFAFEIEEGGLEGKDCEIQFTYRAWQENLDYSRGFSATHSDLAVLSDLNLNRLPIDPIIPDTGLVINEIYPAPLAQEGESPLDREWVELYNNTGFVVDINGWKVVVGSSVHTIGNSCPGTNMMAPYGTSDTTIQSEGFLVIEFCNNSNNAKLPNKGATVSLRNRESLYSSFTYSNASFGKSYSQISDGSGNWLDPCTPTPGTPNDCDQMVASDPPEGASSEPMLMIIPVSSEENSELLEFEDVTDEKSPEESAEPMNTEPSRDEVGETEIDKDES